MEIEEMLGDFAAQVRHGAVGGALYHVAADFKGTAFLPEAAETSRTMNGVRLVEGPPAGKGDSDRAAFRASLEAVDVVSLFIRVPSADGNGEKMKADLRVDALALAGRTAKRWLVEAGAEFRRASGRWRLAGYRVNEVRTEEGLLRFLDVTAASGLAMKPGYDPRPDSGALESAYQFQGGIAAGDYDGDGDADLYVSRIGRNVLFRNDGGRFSATGQAADPDAGSSALFMDADDDGDLDLLLTNYEPESRRALALYRNDGGKFTDVTEAAGLSGRGPAMSAAAADVEGDGDLDFYVCMYRGVSGSEGIGEVPLPFVVYAARNGEPDQLWINQGDGTFEEEGAARGLADAGWGLAVAFADYDDDGDPDLYLANDYGDNKLYRNRGDGTFEDVTAASGTDDTGFGMGVTWFDLDGDGDLDLYVSNMYTTAGNRILSRDAGGLGEDLRGKLRKMARGNTLFRNKGDGTFEDATGEVGGGRAGWSWSAADIDYDNDGRPDLYVTNGFRTSPFGTSDL